jgi:hypothetical protein
MLAWNVISEDACGGVRLAIAGLASGGPQSSVPRCGGRAWPGYALAVSGTSAALSIFIFAQQLQSFRSSAGEKR